MGKTKIEWASDSWNPIRAHRLSTEGEPGRVGWHCEHVSEGCRNCYAETMNRRLGTGLEFKPGVRGAIELFLDEKMLLAPLSWRKPRMIFVCSMTDLFAEFVPDEWINRMFAVMALCPRHTFQILTKRPTRMLHYFSFICNRDDLIADYALAVSGWPKIAHPDRTKEKRMSIMIRVRNQLPNLWAGVSCEDQQTADARVPDLLATPAAVRFVSCEPMLGSINLTKFIQPGAVHHHPDNDLSNPAVQAIASAAAKRFAPRLDWVIIGGESGHGARPMHPDWARSLRDQCTAANVPFFFKQWGEFAWEGQHDSSGREIVWPLDCEAMNKIGKKRAGRLLDGVEHNEFPDVR